MSSTKKTNKPDTSRMKQGNLFSFFTKVAPKQKDSAPKPKSSSNPTPKSQSTKPQKAPNTTPSVIQRSSSNRSSSDSVAANNTKWTKVKIDMKLAVFWPDDSKYYPAVVKKESNDRNRWLLEYEDGDVEWVNLKTEKFRFIDDDDAHNDDDDDDMEMDGDEDDEESLKKSAKKRRRVIQEDSEEEFEFDADVEDDDDDGEYEVENTANKDEDHGDWLVSDDDNASEKPKKRASRSNSSKRLKVVEHGYAAESPSSSSTATVRPKSPSNTTPATFTPKSLSSFSAFSASKSSDAPNRVTPSASTRTGANPIATDDVENNCGGVKALPYVRDAPNPPGSHVHNHLEFLRNPKDASGRAPGEPGYSPRTLKVDFKELQRHYNPPGSKSKPLSPGVQQWWEMKAQYYDTILLFKTGKFYEIFNEDCDIAVSVLGLQYMKGHIAHCGFPEISYGPMADKLARAGYKVARVEQTETPEDLAKRKKKAPRGSANPKVVNREVCSILTMGTRTFCYLDCELACDFSPETTGSGPLLAIKEVLLEQGAGLQGQDDSDTVVPTCEYGVVVVDAARASITLGQFADDILRSRMSTLLHTFNPSEILLEGGENGASPVLRALLKSIQMSSSTKFRVEDILPTESYPRSTAIDLKARQFLERKNGTVQPWNVPETLDELHRRKYFPSASKEDKKSLSTSRWPQVLRLAVEGNAELALSSFGAALYYLQRNLIDHDIISMGLVHAYVPPASPIFETPKEVSNSLTDGPSPDNSSMTLVGARGNEADITHMSIDGNTLVQLDVLLNSLDNKSAGSLAHLIDSTKSPGGSRVLRAWLLRPLFRKADIVRRADAVEELMSGEVAMAMSEASNLLGKVGPIDALLASIHSMSGSNVSPDETGQWDPSPGSRAILYEMKTFTRRKVNNFSKLLNGLRNASKIPELFEGIQIQSALLQKLVRTVSNGGGFPDLSEELDFFFESVDLEKAAEGDFEPSRGADAIFDNACDEIERIRAEFENYKNDMCSRVLKGNSKNVWKYLNTKEDSKDKYTIELPASIKVPAEFRMVGKRGSGAKQVNKYRTKTTEDLAKALEDAIAIHKERKACQLQSVFGVFDRKRNLWSAAAFATSTLDALASLAELGQKPGYCRPEILDCPPGASPCINIVQGRHPCVEKTPCSGDFIPNNLQLGSQEEGEDSPKVLLLSGPNMGGKSTLLRQTCLICILAQIGAMVPAESCSLTPVDVVMTRLGASDRILLGQSTFFVELAETAAALRGATRRSLILFDELGRGTSSFDGTAIASACLSYICKNLKCLSLFATHYHSLLEERKTDPNVRLAHMESSVGDEDDGKDNITFLYTLGDGACPKSFGINVARLARLPEEVLVKAERISTDFELEMNGDAIHKVSPDEAAKQKNQIARLVEEGDLETIEGMWQSLQ